MGEGVSLGIYIEKNRKTKELIQMSFIQILEKKSFESITVGEIAKHAQINRGTFYLHFIDKFDLLDKVEQQLFTNLGSHIDELQSRYLGIFQEDSCKSPVTGHRVFSHLQKAHFPEILLQVSSQINPAALKYSDFRAGELIFF